MKLTAILAAVVAVGGCATTRAAQVDAPVKEIQGTPKAADVPAAPAPAPAPTQPAPATPDDATVAPAPAKPQPTPEPDTLTLTVPAGTDRRSFLLGLYAYGTVRPLYTPQCVDPATGQPRVYIYDSYLKFPVADEPCPCTVETFKATGCTVVRWRETPAPAATAPAAAAKGKK